MPKAKLEVGEMRNVLEKQFGARALDSKQRKNLIFPLVTMKDFKDPLKEMKESINRVR